MTDLIEIPLGSIINTHKYPLMDLSSSRSKELASYAQKELRLVGACELEDFITPLGLAALSADAYRHSSIARLSEGWGTAYDETVDISFPVGHPRRTLGRFSLKIVAYDQIMSSSPLRRLFEFHELTKFIGAMLGRPMIYRYADSLGALNLTYMTEGDEFLWHFDYTDFVVSLAIQTAESGGNFEISSHVRSKDDERYAEVSDVLQGRVSTSEIRQLSMRPGTLILFEGRHSLHRVTEVHGKVPRIVALLGYDTHPGTKSNQRQQLNRYGRHE